MMSFKMFKRRFTAKTFEIMTSMEALRKTEKEISIKAPWGTIAGLSWGNPSDPPVLLCHGKQDTCSGFRPLVSLLPSCFYYVGIDLPGNGHSTHLPPGVRYSTADLVPSILNTVKHFNWKKFIYIGHSLGVPIGKIFNIAYPGFISRVVELDPIPAYLNMPSNKEGLSKWYHHYYSYYDDVSYAKHNGSAETAPKYTYEKAQMMIMNSRMLSKEAAEHVLERCLVPVGDGLYRLTFDQRMKDVTLLPFSADVLKQIYTESETPTFCVVAKKVIAAGIYTSVPFLTDETAWPNRNYRVKIVDGYHDVHIENPACFADDVAKFLLEDSKGKL